MTDPIKAKIQSLCPDVYDTNEIYCSRCSMSYDQFTNKGTKQGILCNFKIDNGAHAWEAGCTCNKQPHELPCAFAGKGSPITLAVVLRATEQQWRTHYTGSYDFGFGRNTLPEGAVLYSLVSKWNLEHDNYDQQSEECKQFIGGLLGIK